LLTRMSCLNLKLSCGIGPSGLCPWLGRFKPRQRQAIVSVSEKTWQS
jgi:hypothetical protein